MDPGYIIERNVFVPVFTLFALAYAFQNYVRASTRKQIFWQPTNVKCLNHLSGLTSSILMVIAFIDRNHVFYTDWSVVFLTKFGFLGAFACLLSCVMAYVYITLNALSSFDKEAVKEAKRRRHKFWLIGGLALTWSALGIALIVMAALDRPWPHLISEAVFSLVLFATGIRMLVVVHRAQRQVLSGGAAARNLSIGTSNTPKTTANADLQSASGALRSGAGTPGSTRCNLPKDRIKSTKAKFYRCLLFGWWTVFVSLLAIGSTAWRAQWEFGYHYYYPVVEADPAFYDISHEGVNVSWGIACSLFLAGMLWFAWYPLPRHLAVRCCRTGELGTFSSSTMNNSSVTASRGKSGAPRPIRTSSMLEDPSFVLKESARRASKDYEPVTQEMDRPALRSVRLSVDIPSTGSDFSLQKIQEILPTEENDTSSDDMDPRCRAESKDEALNSTPELAV